MRLRHYRIVLLPLSLVLYATMKSLVFTLFMITVSKTSFANQDEVTVRIHDDYIKINETSFPTFEMVRDSLTIETATIVTLMVHHCADTSLVIKVLDFVKTKTDKPVNFKAFGKLEEEECR